MIKNIWKIWDDEENVISKKKKKKWMKRKKIKRSRWEVWFFQLSNEAASFWKIRILDILNFLALNNNRGVSIISKNWMATSVLLLSSGPSQNAQKSNNCSAGTPNLQRRSWGGLTPLIYRNKSDILNANRMRLVYRPALSLACIDCILLSHLSSALLSFGNLDGNV